MDNMSPTKTKVLMDKSKSTLIIPLVYKEGESDSENWIETSLPRHSSLLDHINQLFQTDEGPSGKGKIGKVFRLNKKYRDQFGLPKNESNTFHLQNDKDEDYAFKVTDIQLYLFETYVGFLVYHIQHTEHDINKIVTLNYQLKHLHHFNNGSLVTQKEKFMGEASEHRTLASITTQLLEPFKIKHYFTSYRNQPEVALVFNFILMDQGFQHESDFDSRLHYHLFQLRKSYKASYQPAPHELRIDQNEHHVQLFENNYWGISFEGVSNLVFLGDDDKTNAFFQGNYLHNLNTYFYIYILALHQRYGLLQLQGLASDLPYSDDTLLEEENDRSITIPKLRKMINFFILRCYFLHVSNITHQQDFYNQLSKTLNIQELKKDLSIELEALSSIAELEKNKMREIEREKRQKAEKLEQERKEKNADTVLIYSTIFVIISAISGAWDILSNLFIWDGKPVVPYPAVSALLILSIVCIIVGFLSYYFIKKKW